MQENFKQEKRSNALYIVAICLLFVLFTASIFLAVIAPVFTSNGVASADSSYGSVGSVNYNLFTNPKFDKQGDNVFAFQNKFAQDVVYADGTTLSYVSSNGGFVVSTTTVAGANHWMAFLFKPSTTGSYTFTINSDIVGKPGYKFRLRDTSYNTYVDSDSANFTDYISITYNITDLSKNYILQFLMPTADVSASIYWLKIEQGSSFTGYVPNYQDTIQNLQNDNKDLQEKVESLESAMNFNFLTTLSRENLYYYNQASPDKNGTGSYTFLPNAYDTTLSEAERNFSCPIDGYSSQTANRPYLFGIELPYEISAGSTLRLSYTALCVGAIFTGVPFSELWRLGYTYAFYCGQYGYPTTDNIGQLTVVDSFNNSNGNIFITVNQPTNFIAFDVVSRSNYSNKLIGYLKFTDDGVFSLETSASVGASWYLAFNSLSFYYQGDMLASAVDSARQEGYNKGYQEGKVAGREVGYQEGVKDQGDYSFMGLLGAVFDAPIQAFKGLLSFEVLGVDMSAFVSSLFGLAVILLILKLILGGGK